MKNIPPDGRRQDRLPKVGLCDQKRGNDAEEDDGEQVARNLRLPRMLGKEPRTHDDESRLHELGGLDRNAGQGDPASGALDLDAEEQRQQHHAEGDNQQDDRRAPHLARRQEGEPNHDTERGDHEGRVSLDEVERLQPDALGDRWRRGERQHEADAHQEDEHRQKKRSMVQNQSARGPRSARLTMSFISCCRIDQHGDSVERCHMADKCIAPDFEVLILVEACASRR